MRKKRDAVEECSALRRGSGCEGELFRFKDDYGRSSCIVRERDGWFGVQDEFTFAARGQVDPLVAVEFPGRPMFGESPSNAGHRGRVAHKLTGRRRAKAPRRCESVDRFKNARLSLAVVSGNDVDVRRRLELDARQIPNVEE